MRPTVLRRPSHRHPGHPRHDTTQPTPCYQRASTLDGGHGQTPDPESTVPQFREHCSPIPRALFPNLKRTFPQIPRALFPNPERTRALLHHIRASPTRDHLQIAVLEMGFRPQIAERIIFSSSWGLGKVESIWLHKVYNWTVIDEAVHGGKRKWLLDCYKVMETRLKAG